LRSMGFYEKGHAKVSYDFKLSTHVPYGSVMTGTTIFLDESLRWLLANGKTKQAMKIIKKAASWNNQSFESVMESVKKKQPLTSMELVIQTPEKPESNGDHQPLEGNGTAEVKQKVHKYSAFTILKHKKILIVSVLLWVIW
ncbi:hypothetical protein AM593_01425, partial [Mytilus galloprovincialis]